MKLHRPQVRRQTAASASRRRLPYGQSLVEFAVVALVTYMLLAAILTFGHLFYVAQAVQQAVDVGARELSRTPLPATAKFEEDVLTNPVVKERIYSEDYLVFNLDMLGIDQSFFQDVVPSWPLLNQQLAQLMIVDHPDFDGDGQADANLLRYPGALLSHSGTPSGFTVGIPLVTSRGASGSETIRWVAVVEEIDSEQENDNSGNAPDPFDVTDPSGHRGIVALRINYPFQAAAMTGFRANPDGPFEPNIANPNVADDSAVLELNATERAGDLIGQPLVGGGVYGGTYGGPYGLGAQGALASQQLTGGLPVRPYRRVVSAQAIYRREVFE
jgi:hypothetical protein